MPSTEKRKSYLARRAAMLAALVVKHGPLNKKNRKPAGHAKHAVPDPDLVDGWEDVVDTTQPADEEETAAVKKINKGWVSNNWSRLQGRPMAGGLPSLGKRR